MSRFLRCCPVLLQIAVLLPVVVLLIVCGAGCHGGRQDAAISEAPVCPCQGGLLGDLNGSGTLT